MSAQLGGPGSTSTVRVLGTPSLVVDGTVHEVREHRQASLLALFASQPGVVLSREAIEDQLWRGRPVSAAALRVNVMRLREHFASAGLGDPFRTTARGYSLDLAPDSLDSQVFRRLAAATVDARARSDPGAAVAAPMKGIGCGGAPPSAGSTTSRPSRPSAPA